MKNLLKTFRRSEDGVTLVEYGIAITLAIVVGGAALGGLGGGISTAMNVASSQMCSTAPASGATTC